MKKLIAFLMVAVCLFTFSLGASAKTTKGDLSSEQALKIALEARKHYWNAMNGHIAGEKNSKCSSETFKYKGKEYRYFCSELGTKKKLTNYLNEVFTLNAINKGMKKYSFIQYKGKMAQPNADHGSLLEWEKAKLKLQYKKSNVRLYEFTVPYGDKGEQDKRKVTFVKVKNKWQINAFDAVK